MGKELYRPTGTTNQISGIQFGLYNHKDIRKQSVVNVLLKELYSHDSTEGQRVSMEYGVLDARMGINQKEGKCTTCGQSIYECIGHFGHVDLSLPVFHIGYFRHIIEILQTICKNPLCARVMLTEKDKVQYHRKVENPNLSYITKKVLNKQIREKAKKCTTCPYCEYTNGTVKKSGVLRISHEKYRNKKYQALKEECYKATERVAVVNPELEKHRNALLIENLNPQRVLQLLQAIPIDDVPYLLMTRNFSCPEDLMFTKIPVPPNCIRPSVVSDIKAGTNEDDLTMKLSEIVLMNNVVEKHNQAGAKTQMVSEDWESLQLHCALYINSEMSGIPPSMQTFKPIRGLVQRLKGKQGRFRGNLSGKRADFTARTVISPDPYLKIDQVGIPVHVAKILTYPERVHPANKELMRQLVHNGADVHPGANYVDQGGVRRYLRYGDRHRIARELNDGDIVERHLMDKDIVLFNRQPSLHKLSIMSLKAKIIPDRTFKFNECNCTPYNADFDGDEMNVHFPQTEEAKAECAVLMDNKSNLVTPKNGEILIAATQDFITGTYLLTLRDTFLDKAQISRLIAWIVSDPGQGMDVILPPPCILKPQYLWSGKQVISILLRPNRNDVVKVNLRTKGRKYTNGEDMCYKDSFIVVRNSELLLGTLDKATIGSGSKQNIFYALYRDWGKEVAIECMLKLSRVSAYFLMNLGFSMGIGDVTGSQQLLETKDRMLNEGYKKCDGFITNMQEGKLECHPGLTEEQTLEAVILKELSSIREYAGKSCFTELHPSNSALIMAVCGSKGSVINLSQMIACVGQQAISGKRVPNGFGDRSLPHFKRGSQDPVARGFCQNSYYTGLYPTEFYFHTMAGREGLIDTAVKTSETGYMQRRLVKALEDLSVCYDMTVRNSEKDIIQFEYGDDNLDPTFMEGDGRPVNFQFVYENVTANFPCRDEPLLKPLEIKEKMAKELESHEFSNTTFSADLKEFTDQIAEKVQKVLDSVYDIPVYAETCRVTKTHHREFFNACRRRYIESIVEPGTAVGCLAAQSIGEPGTQMTLKTFHFAGVASMNITQGVPRIKEIINCARSLSTPIITAHLENDTDEDFARKVKGRIEKTMLSEIAQYFEKKLTRNGSYLVIKLAMVRIKLLQLEIDAYTVVDKILSSKAGIKPEQIRIKDDAIYISRSGKQGNISKELNTYRETLKSIVVQGIPSVNRAFIHTDVIKGVKHYKIIAESEDLLAIMGVRGVVSHKCYSNSIFSAFATLGIEAARQTIISEIKSVMENHGMSIDIRHITLLADLMTYKGEPLGITRHGMAKMKESVLNLASFEKTADHLFDAAYYGQVDKINGVSECIITGTPVTLGTGYFKVLHRTQRDESVLFKKRKLLFANPEYHKSTIST